MVVKLYATRNKEFLIKLFSVHIRPYLEYAAVIWNSYNVGFNVCRLKEHKDVLRDVYSEVMHQITIIALNCLKFHP